MQFSVRQILSPRYLKVPATHAISATFDNASIRFEREFISAAGGGPTKLTAPRGTTGIAVISKKKLALDSRHLLLATSIIFAILGLAASSTSLPQLNWLSGSRHLPPGTSEFLVQLDVEARGDGLSIEWNPQAAPIIQAREGRLVILENDKRPRILSLSPQELANGHLYYGSFAERIQFQLETVDAAGRFSRASVLVLSPAVTPPVRTGPQTLTVKQRLSDKAN